MNGWSSLRLYAMGQWQSFFMNSFSESAEWKKLLRFFMFFFTLNEQETPFWNYKNRDSFETIFSEGSNDVANRGKWRFLIGWNQLQASSCYVNSTASSPLSDASFNYSITYWGFQEILRGRGSSTALQKCLVPAPSCHFFAVRSKITFFSSFFLVGRV